MSVASRLITPESTALVVIDFQEKLTPHIDDLAKIVDNTKLLLRLAEILKLKTFLTTQYEIGLGKTLPEIAELAPPPLDKVCFGCFGDDGFRAALDEAMPNKGTLLVAGIEAHICVAQTVLGALEAGYAVHVAADAVSSRTAANRQIGIDRMRQAGAVISSTEMAIYELLRLSKRPEFKAMLPYLR